jgi:hypothetical protein
MQKMLFGFFLAIFKRVFLEKCVLVIRWVSSDTVTYYEAIEEGWVLETSPTGISGMTIKRA